MKEKSKGKKSSLASQVGPVLHFPSFFFESLQNEKAFSFLLVYKRRREMLETISFLV